ncbi:hypothetical protein QR680_003601 [Steinernema hermaphroditum]|uniref:Uncharacterized protein n=1 Tax=Steinernema hermaphroditum TaxID=289476 RepID=A0AA39HN83_9BILA|nr:hypothetical protein QR680_003601 [Steinernema hermaphroditum]
MSVASHMNAVQESTKNEVTTVAMGDADSSSTEGPIVRESQQNDMDAQRTTSAATYETTLGVPTSTLTMIVAVISLILAILSFGEVLFLWSDSFLVFMSIPANSFLIICAICFVVGFYARSYSLIRMLAIGCGVSSMDRLIIGALLGVLLAKGNKAAGMSKFDENPLNINPNVMYDIILSVAIVNGILFCRLYKFVSRHCDAFLRLSVSRCKSISIERSYMSRIVLSRWLFCFLVVVGLSAVAKRSFEVFHVRINDKSTEVISVTNEVELQKFEKSADGKKCAKAEMHIGAVSLKSVSGKVEDLMLICCHKKNCSSFVADGTLTLQGLRHLSNFEVGGDERSRVSTGKSCINLDGYYETHDSDACILHIDDNGVFGGSLASYSPFGNERDAIKCDAGDMCYRQLTQNEYQLTCCCFHGSSGCAYSTGYETNTQRFYNRFMAVSSNTDENEDMRALNFFHRDASGKRKVHCAYGTFTENPIGGGIAYAKNGSIYIGTDDVPQMVERGKVEAPKSTCGLQFRFKPYNVEQSLYSLEIVMGSFDECTQPEVKYSKWRFLKPSCPLEIKENDVVSFLRCCNNMDGCNHISKYFNSEALERMALGRKEFGYHFPWRDVCGHNAVMYFYMLNHPRHIGRCDYFYDIAKDKILDTFGWTELWESKKLPFERFKCKRRTVLLGMHKQCTESFVYDISDCPVRDYIHCSRMHQPGDARPTNEFLMDLFMKAHEKLKYHCLSTGNVPIDLGQIEDVITVTASPIRACYFIVQSTNGRYMLQAGPVSELEEAVFEFYNEHFISQLLVDGIAYSYNSTAEQTILICAGNETLCQQKEILTELMLPIQHMNILDSDFLRAPVCGKERCVKDLGCYKYRSLIYSSSPKEGCISNIGHEDSHLLKCMDGTWRSGQKCSEVKATKDGELDFYRVCCYGSRFHDVDRLFIVAC